ncbi:MAG TPA: CHAT domain-containing tetratricopeptide repeat protein [Blastocatellia bacterium]|nr:CHAT domain-containing tetratricopeptide repeat protein [Blastocatellia bacterium]
MARDRSPWILFIILLLCVTPAIGNAQNKQSGQAQLEEAKRLQQQVAELYEKDRIDEAIEVAKRSLAIREKLLPPDSPDVAESLNDLGVLYLQTGELEQAGPLLARALAVREKALKADDPLIVESLINLAEVYRSDSNYRSAAPLLERVVSLHEQALGPEHGDLAESLNNLALLYMDMGDFNRAEPLLERALAIREKVFGPDHAAYAQSLNNLAALYRDKGEYTSAESLFERALAIREREPGPDQSDLASSLNNLAGLYQLKGDYERAEPLFERALAMREQAQPDSLAVAEAVNNLALLHKQKKDYETAESLYLRSLDIREKRLKPDHPDVATALSNLSLLYLEKNDLARAEQLIRRALSIREKALGNSHFIYAQSVSSLASLYFLKGEYKLSESLHRRALEIFERALGPQHPLTCLSRNNLAQILNVNGRLGQAASLLALNNEIRERTLAPILSVGSERQKLAFMKTISEETDFTLSFHTAARPKDPQAARLALTTVLRRKGRVIDVMADMVNVLRRRATAEDRKLLEQLSATRAQLASLMVKGSGEIGPSEHRAAIARLEAEAQRLESRVSARSSQFRAQSQPVTLPRVQRAIPFGSSLVEFALYRPFNPRPKATSEVFGPPRYVAYVVRKTGPPAWVELGDAKEIDGRIDTWREALSDPGRADVKQLARAVDMKVLQPVRRLLGNNRRVLLSPDGALNLIPFAALVDESGRYLVGRYTFRYLTAGRDLLRMHIRARSAQPPVVLADPDYGQESEQGAERGLLLSKGKSETVRSIDFSQVYFNRLPGTAAEARSLEQILQGEIMYVRERATESAVKNVSAPEVLHIATHGFFLEDVLSPSERDSRGLAVKKAGSKDSSTPVLRIENPLLRSGLAFAGANERQGGAGEDGILTALEAVGLNLWGTKLVVLSACNTGVGEVKTGDGVYGLRRAFVIAGAESQVMSLWPVDDQGTRDLMITYYKMMRAGRDQTEALREAQLRMMSREASQHPYYWACFINSGR